MREKSLPFFYYGFSQLSTSEFLKREMEMHETKNHLLCGWWNATIRKYIQDQEKSDIMQDKLSVKEYEDPFKG